MDAKKNFSSRPSSGEKKKMEVINPRKLKADPVSKSKTISSKKLEKVPNSYSPSTTLSDFSSTKPILESEKQKLELLTSDPLSFTPSVSDERSKNLKFIEETLRVLQSQNEERENDETYERLVDTLRSSEAAERFERMKKLEEFAEQIRNQKDEFGNSLIEFPEDFDEIIESAVEYKKNNGTEDVDWLEVFKSRHEHEKIDESYRKKREKIRELDLILKEKEKMLRELRTSRGSERSKDSESNSSNKGSVFITKVKTRQNQNKPLRPSENFIKKNIESVEDFKATGSKIDKLSQRDKERLAIIEEKLGTIEEYSGILPEDSVLRLEEIDKALRNYIPQIK